MLRYKNQACCGVIVLTLAQGVYGVLPVIHTHIAAARRTTVRADVAPPSDQVSVCWHHRIFVTSEVMATANTSVYVLHRR